MPVRYHLHDEISALRVLIRRLMERIEADPEAPDLLKVVETASRASWRLASMIAAQQRLENAQNAAAGDAELEERIAELARTFSALEKAGRI